MCLIGLVSEHAELMRNRPYDTYKAHRMEKMQNELSVYRCHTIFNCARTCPKGLNPAAAIAKMKMELAAE